MITVCMATHNGELFLREQINSILFQLGGGDELIIVDDYSTDNTRNILSSYADDPRVKIILNSSVCGISQTFERSIRHAKGTYLFLADQDDVWHPQKKEITLRYLANTDLVVSDCTIVDKQLSQKHESFYELNILCYLYLHEVIGLDLFLFLKESDIRADIKFPRLHHNLHGKV